MEYLWIILGVLVGSVISSIIFSICHKTVGVLRIDHSNPEKDVYRFELSNLDELSRKKHIVLKIDNNANLSQK